LIINKAVGNSSAT